MNVFYYEDNVMKMYLPDTVIFNFYDQISYSSFFSNFIITVCI